MTRLKFIICIIACCCAITSVSQDIPLEIKSWLSKTELVKIQKAKIKIDQGEQMLFAHLLRNDTVQKNGLNYLNMSANMIVGKKESRLLMQTKDYFEIGFDIQLDIYKRYINHFVNNSVLRLSSKYSSLNDSVDVYLDDAKFYRDKSGVKGNLQVAANYVHKSNVNLQSALLLCERLMIGIKEGGEEPEMLVLEDDIEKRADKVNNKQLYQHDESTEAEKNNVTKIKVDTEMQQVSIVSEKNIYFTVQILADRKIVSDSRIKQVYKGSYPIIENKGDGWYRYSFGKFFDYSDAKKALLSSNIKGYVVAYKQKVRISVREAINLLQNVTQ